MNPQGKVFIEAPKKEINIEELVQGPYFLIFRDKNGRAIHWKMFVKSR
jgi:hypothetical protein